MLYPSQFNDDSSDRSYTMDVDSGVKCFRISCGIMLCIFLTLSLFLIITGALLIEEERQLLTSYDSTKHSLMFNPGQGTVPPGGADTSFSNCIRKRMRVRNSYQA